jgi:hypothetical protein
MWILHLHTADWKPAQPSWHRNDRLCPPCASGWLRWNEQVFAVQLLIYKPSLWTHSHTWSHLFGGLRRGAKDWPYMRHNYPLTLEVSPCRLPVMYISRSECKKPAQLLPGSSRSEEKEITSQPQNWNDQEITDLCSVTLLNLCHLKEHFKFLSSFVSCILF